MGKQYVNQAMSKSKKGRSLKISLILLANILFVSFLYFKDTNDFTALISILLIILNISAIMYYRVIDIVNHAKLTNHISSFDSQLCNFFNNFHNKANNLDETHNEEIISILPKLNLYGVTSHINYYYDENSDVKTIDLVTLSTNLDEKEYISIYSKILEFAILKYMDFNDYAPSTFVNANLYKECKNIVSNVYMLND